MKKIEQHECVTFSAPSIQDAIVMAPLMDRLAKEFVAHSKAVAENPEDAELVKEYIQLGHQLHTLEEVGFCTSCPGMIQYNPQYFPA